MDRRLLAPGGRAPQSANMSGLHLLCVHHISNCDHVIVNAVAMVEDFEASLSCDKAAFIETVAENDNQSWHITRHQVENLKYIDFI